MVNKNGKWVRMFHISKEATYLMDKIANDHSDDMDVMNAYARLKDAC